MNSKIHANNLIFLYLEWHYIVKKEHRDKLRESMEERKQLYILVTLTALFTLLSEQGALHLHLALGHTNDAASLAEGIWDSRLPCSKGPYPPSRPFPQIHPSEGRRHHCSVHS